MTHGKHRKFGPLERHTDRCVTGYSLTIGRLSVQLLTHRSPRWHERQAVTQTGLAGLLANLPGIDWSEMPGTDRPTGGPTTGTYPPGGDYGGLAI